MGGPLTLVSNVSGKKPDVEYDDDDGSDNEGFVMNLDDEVVAYYSNNKVNKFFKKPFNLKFKGSDFKGNSSGKNVRDKTKTEKKKENKSEVEKLEKKLKGNSGFNFQYCNGVNHMVADGRGMKKEDKKERVKD